MPISAHELPPPGPVRWVPRRKLAVLAAIREGRLSRVDAMLRYDLSDEELKAWERALACVGEPGLRVTRTQVYRPVFEGADGRTRG